MDFLNKNQKVYIGEEEKKVFLEKLKRDVEVSSALARPVPAGAFHSRVRWIPPLSSRRGF